MGYRVDKKNDKFHVVEQTNMGDTRNIKSFDIDTVAKDMKKFLNNGGAFAGWTPSFFTIDTTTVKR